MSDELREVGLIALVLLGLSVWFRMPRRDGGVRWWEGNPLKSHLVLLMLPGVGLWALAGVSQLLFGDSSWILLGVVPALIGTVMVVWGLLILPIPRWFLPGDVRGRANAGDESPRPG